MSLDENATKTSRLHNSLSVSPSTDSSFLLTPEFSLRPRKVQPPKTLSLQSKIFVHSPQMDRVSNKMASIESIGACSLDVEGSESSCNSMREDVTVSERTLQSASVIISSGGSTSHSTADVPKENGFRSSSTEKRSPDSKSEHSPSMNGHVKDVKEECTVAEIKLPSYVSISCAINGYTNYSRFCRSRDNSPARIAFNKLSPYKGQEESPGHSVSNGHSLVADHCGVSNALNHLYTESKELIVRKQLQVPVKTTKTYKASQEIVIGSGSYAKGEIKGATTHYDSDSLVNGHGNEVHTLAQEVGDAGCTHKSLVQQRIESLYGESSSEGAKVLGYRVSRLKTPLEMSSVKNGSLYQTKRSPSCPPQASRSQSRSPPVFRHLKKDFRDQLRGSASYPQPNKMSWHIKRNSINNSTNFTTSSKGTSENNIEPHSEQPALSPNLISSELFHLKKDTTQTGTLSDPSKQLSSSKINSTISSKPLLQPKPPSLSQNASPILTVKENLSKPHNLSNEKDGHAFLSLMNATKEEIKHHIEILETELQESSIPEDASGKIRAAVGKANLLLSQKFEQFRELCNKNIAESPSDPFYTTSSDLAGFWDMVLLQVADVKTTFDEINKMKENGWNEIIPEKSTLPVKIKRSPAKGASKSNPSTPKRSAKATEMAKAREQARKELMAAKKRGRQQHASQEEAEISIFTPDNAN